MSQVHEHDVRAEDQHDGPALRPRDWRAVEDEFLASGTPRHVVVDDFLSPHALAALRASMGRDDRWVFLHKGSPTENLPGPAPELMSALGEELTQALPRILAGLGMTDSWAIRYHRSTGLHVHSDTGSVTVNFYITDDRHNLTPGRGGLVLSAAQRPTELSLLEYNTAPWGDAYFQRADDGTRIPIAYRCNRAIIFDSRTFHASDAFRFEDTGDSTRRVNVGMVFDDPAAPSARRQAFVATIGAMRERAAERGADLGSLSLEEAEALWTECLDR